jgi:hypothetical protein
MRKDAFVIGCHNGGIKPDGLGNLLPDSLNHRFSINFD